MTAGVSLCAIVLETSFVCRCGNREAVGHSSRLSSSPMAPREWSAPYHVVVLDEMEKTLRRDAPHGTRTASAPLPKPP